MTQEHEILVSTAVQASNATNACHKVIAISLVTHMIIVQKFTTLLQAKLLFNGAFTVVNSYLPPFEKGGMRSQRPPSMVLTLRCGQA